MKGLTSTLRNLYVSNMKLNISSLQSIRNIQTSRAKRRIIETRKRFENKIAEMNKAKPSFESLFREMQKKVHPDILRSSHPQEASINEGSLQIINSVLSVVKESGNLRPDPWGGVIQFYVKQDNKTINSETGETGEEENTAGIKLVEVLLDTTGKRKIKKAFEEMFALAGVGDGTGSFDWGSSYYKYPVQTDRRPKRFSPEPMIP